MVSSVVASLVGRRSRTSAPSVSHATVTAFDDWNLETKNCRYRQRREMKCAAASRRRQATNGDLRRPAIDSSKKTRKQWYQRNNDKCRDEPHSHSLAQRHARTSWSSVDDVVPLYPLPLQPCTCLPTPPPTNAAFANGLCHSLDPPGVHRPVPLRQTLLRSACCCLDFEVIRATLSLSSVVAVGPKMGVERCQAHQQTHPRCLEPLSSAALHLHIERGEEVRARQLELVSPLE